MQHLDYNFLLLLIFSIVDTQSSTASAKVLIRDIAIVGVMVASSFHLKLLAPPLCKGIAWKLGSRVGCLMSTEEQLFTHL
jgi:hypothetical protein